MSTTAAGLRWRALLLSLPFLFSNIQAQTIPAGIQHVKWPLLDMVTVADSNGVWILVAPTPGTTQWNSGSNIVSVCIDPVLLLQWTTVARKLAAGEAPVTPKLRDRTDSSFIILGKNPRKAPDRSAFVLVASDSAAGRRWMAYASSAEVDTLLMALERAAGTGRELVNSAAEPEPDTPVSVVHIPRPAYPGALAFRGRVGRVWMEFVVGPDGRPREESFRPLLSDDPRFTSAAIYALRRGRFKPATLKGQPVPQRVFQVIEFRMRK